MQRMVPWFSARVPIGKQICGSTWEKASCGQLVGATSGWWLSVVEKCCGCVLGGDLVVGGPVIMKWK